jgi:hypothetical protein
MADLITLDDFKEAEGLNDLDNDSRLQAIISSVSQLVKTYCANSFVDYYDTDYSEEFTIDWDTYALQLTESPVVSITEVKERDNYGSDYVTLTEGANEFYVDLATDTIYRTTDSGWTNWPQGPGAVKVSYKAGYTAIPYDLKLAVIDLINYYWLDEYKPSRTLGGSTMSNTTTSTQWRNVGFPDHIKRILDLYKQIQV